MALLNKRTIKEIEEARKKIGKGEFLTEKELGLIESPPPTLN